MPAFPTSPIAPAEFMENFLPTVFAELRIPAVLAEVDESLGVRLHGDEGGSWRIRLQGGDLSVEAGEFESVALTLLQSHEDWRGALWSGHGGPFGRYAAKLFTPRIAEILEGIRDRTPDPQALEPLREIEGRLAIVVTGGEGGDWRIDLKLGTGETPDAPNTTISITAEDAEALSSRELKPLEAFMAGRIQLEGDVGFAMQLQGAIAKLTNGAG